MALVSVNCIITVYLGYYMLSTNGWDWAVVLGLIEAIAFSCISFGIAFLTVRIRFITDNIIFDVNCM